MWTIDLERRTATHDVTRLVVRFRRNADGSLDGAPDMPLPDSVTITNAARLMREAGDAYAAALRRVET